MNKGLFAVFLFIASLATAQESRESTVAKPRLSPGANATPAPEKKGPTEITAEKEATFDDKAHVAIFLGAVHVVDPQFTLTADKVTAYLKKETGAVAPSATPKSGPNETASPTPGARVSPPNENAKTARSNDNSADSGGGLDRAVAEGNVVIVQDKPDPDGGPPEHYVGKGERADYDTKTGNIVLSGWPQVQQGINSHVATEGSTVMTLNRSGTIKTEGKSKTVIEDSSRDNKR